MKGSRLGLVILALCFVSPPVFPQGSAKVVKVNPGASAYQIRRGGAAQIAVNIEIDEGYHINSNRPSDKNLIATSLKLDRTAGLTATPIIYPKAKLQKFEFSRKPLSVFEGKVALRFTARALTSLSAGDHALTGKLTVQACNNQQCLRPQTINVKIPLQVQ
jgi:thiol:disulfide interchange protein DsbD